MLVMILYINNSKIQLCLCGRIWKIKDRFVILIFRKVETGTFYEGKI